MHISIQQVDVHVPTYKKRALSDSFFILACGERGIRTPGASQLNGFQDRRNRPLCHLSFVGMRLSHERRLSASLGRPRFLLYPRSHELLGCFLEVIFSNRVQKYCFFFKYTNFLQKFLPICEKYSNFAPKIVQNVPTDTQIEDSPRDGDRSKPRIYW